VTIRWDAAAQPRSWTWTSPSEREKRDGRIRELYAMGHSRRELADIFDLTPQRIDQIVRKR
jgi:hypothetical protein